jgi:hypothetical protein
MFADYCILNRGEYARELLVVDVAVADRKNPIAVMHRRIEQQADDFQMAIGGGVVESIEATIGSSNTNFGTPTVLK